MDPKSKRGTTEERLQQLLHTIKDHKHLSSNFKALAEIRSQYMSDPTKLKLFIHAGGMKHIVSNLKCENKKIVDVALSILGHCVLEQEPRVVFRKEGGLVVLAKVLRSYDDSRIQSRCCRAIGSLAHDKRNTEKFIMELEVHFTLGQILDRSTDEETLCMTIRAIQHIANSKEHIAILGKNYIIPKLSVLLIKSDNVNVQKKLFLTLTHIFGYMKRFSETSAHYWFGNDDGGKFVARLVELRHSNVPAISTKAPQLLHQIVQDKNVRPFLAGKEAFEALLPLVKEERELGKCGTTVYMTVLLNLCRESPNRFTQHGGIPLLLDLIRDSHPIHSQKRSEKPSKRLIAHHSSIFSTLLAFKYDVSALSELVQNGLVEILSEKLERYVLGCKEEKRKKESEEDNSQNNQEDEESTRPCGNSGCKVRCQIKRRYRTTSPSYQAVELEFDQLSRLRESRSGLLQSSTALNIFGWNSEQPYRNDVDGVSVSSSPRSIVSSSPSQSSLLAWSECSSDEGELSESNFESSTGKCSPVYSSDFSSSPGSSDFSSSPVCSPSTSLMSPLHPPSFPSSSDFDESDDEFDDQTIRYSPVCNEPNPDLGSSTFSTSPSSSGPCKKKPRMHPSTQRTRKSCCETDLKMLWLKLGQIENKDFYENWPEFTLIAHHQDQEIAVYMILKLSWMDETPQELVRSETLKALIDYLVETPRPTFRACQILFRLASVPSLFVDLLRMKFPSEIYLALNRRIGTVPCCPLHSCLRRVCEQILEQMSATVDRFGRGEMESLLLKNSENSQVTEYVALATPLLVKSRSLLRRFLEELHILDVIFLLLNSERMLEHAAASLSSLGCVLKMDDMICPTTCLGDVFKQGVCQVADLEEDVFFHISSQEAVGGIRRKLQEASFFEAMFRGGFQESKATVITLTGIQAPILKVILHCIYGCGSQCSIIRGIEVIARSDKEAVNLLESLDRFLLQGLLESVSNLIASQDWCSCPETFASLWSALDNGFSFSSKLKNHLLYFPFSSATNFDRRFKVISVILASDKANDARVNWKDMFLTKLEEK